LPVFDCAFKPANGIRSIRWQAHVAMMAAAQPFLSGAISKTVNMPSDVTPKDIAEAYFWGWELGLKAIAIYRDGSKQSQPLNTKQDDSSKRQATAEPVPQEVQTVERIVYKPHRERLEDTRQSLTHKFSISGHEGYLCVGLYPDGRPGEIFITMAKEGSTIGGIMDSFGTALSIALQYGVPLEVLVNKFSHTRFEPMGHTTNKDIRIAKSVVDYIARWLGLTFLSGHPEFGRGTASSQPEAGSPPAGNGAPVVAAIASPRVMPGTAAVADPTSVKGIGARPSRLSGPTDQFARFQSDAPSCDNCGSITVRNGNCYLCHNCGNSMGCS
ncbi:MAG: vitamin B12-dependent ribonucleotide reductase, partial [Planctomycetaceae bacterium]